MLRKGPPAPIPALATAMSNTPSEFAAALTASFTAPALVTSQTTVAMLSGEAAKACNRSSASFRTSFRRPAIVTFALAVKSFAAIPNPIPVPPPVTSAVFERKSVIPRFSLSVVYFANRI